MKRIKGLISVFTSALVLSAFPFTCSADETASISIGENMECAPGQFISMDIDVKAGNDFESAEFIYSYNNSDIEIKEVYSAVPNLSIAYNNFQDDGYIKICVYSNNGEPIPDGKIVGVKFVLPEQEGEYTFGLTADVFATCQKGMAKVEDITAVYSAFQKLGDANGDNTLNVRDAAFISRLLAAPDKENNTPPAWADFTGDGVVNVRDAAAIARMIACSGKTN